MKITVIGRKCTPRDSFKEHAEKKLSKIDKFFGDSATAKVTATVEKSSQTVEITVLNDGMIFRAQAKADNMNEALDDCVDLLIRQIRKNKTKLKRDSVQVHLMIMQVWKLKKNPNLSLSEQNLSQSNRSPLMRQFFR